jgi:hypothetical protein
MSISILLVYKLIVHEEVQMFTQTQTQLVQWQNLKVMSEADLVLNLAQQKRWKDCQIFGHGDMITQPLESQGWKLIPADLYEYSIPAKGVDRLLKVIDAGVHIQGVIIADDTRRRALTHTPAKPVVSLATVKMVFSAIGIVLLVSVAFAGLILLGLVIAKALYLLIPLLFLSPFLGFDPQLIILVDDGNGGTTWISVLTWFE